MDFRKHSHHNRNPAKPTRRDCLGWHNIFWNSGTYFLWRDSYWWCLLECLENNCPSITTTWWLSTTLLPTGWSPDHYSLAVRQYLDDVFPGKWIGRRGAVEFPPRSPDLTPMDFCVWGIVKDSLFAERPNSVADLREFISESLDQWHWQEQRFMSQNLPKCFLEMSRMCWSTGQTVWIFTLISIY